MIENAIDTLLPILVLAGMCAALLAILVMIGFMVYYIWYEVYGNWLYEYIDPIVDKIKSIFKK